MTGLCALDTFSLSVDFNTGSIDKRWTTYEPIVSQVLLTVPAPDLLDKPDEDTIGDEPGSQKKQAGDGCDIAPKVEAHCCCCEHCLPPPLRHKKFAGRHSSGELGLLTAAQDQLRQIQEKQHDCDDEIQGIHITFLVRLVRRAVLAVREFDKRPEKGVYEWGF